MDEVGAGWGEEERRKNGQGGNRRGGEERRESGDGGETLRLGDGAG